MTRFRLHLTNSLSAALAAASLGTSLLVAPCARAASTPADAAAAQGLFDEAKKLIAGKQYAAARPKLEESERLDPSPSTEFFLADCYEQLGQSASAWALFLQVASESKAAGRPEREQFARKRADALAPKVSRLLISVSSQANIPGLEVQRDGKLVGLGQWGTAVAVDPGKHTLHVAAPNYVAWDQTVDVLGGGKTTTVDVPPLVPMSAPALAAIPPASATPEPPASSSSTPSAKRHGLQTQRVVAIVLGGIGLVGLGVGSVFGVQAVNKNDESKSNGCNGNLCNATGYATRHDAQSDGRVSTVLVGVGAAALVGGAVLWLTAPPHADSAPARGITVGLAANGVFLGGKFE